jgi:transposase
MAVKSFQAKLACRSADQKHHLERTHRLFNHHVRQLLPLLAAARKGRHGPEYRSILSTVKSAHGAAAQVEAISSLTACPGTSAPNAWRRLAKELVERGQILFDRKLTIPSVHKEFRRKVFEMAFQIILSHEAKMEDWRKQHAKWRDDKAQWENEHPQYMTVRPAIDQFEHTEGQAAKRRGRWHRWLDFLAAHPELAAWRGGQPHVEQLTQHELQAARRSRRRAVADTFEKFFAKNPELKELDRLHGEYQRRFVRPWAKRRHHDGFFHPPTLTLPSFDRHPAWYSFKRGDTYRKLDPQAGSIELRVLKSSNPSDSNRHSFEHYQFIPDKRLSALIPAPQTIASGRIQCDLLLLDQDNQNPRPARFQGAKLLFRNAQAYLYFSLYLEDLPSRLPLKQSQIDKYSPHWCLNKIRGQAYQPPLRTMAIDLGIRHVAAATIMEGDRLMATRFIGNRPVSPLTGRQIHGIPSLPQIKIIKDRLRRTRRKFGKPLKAQTSCRRLQAHIRKMSQDRFKKAAAAVVHLARAHRVDLILMEKLGGLVPDAAKERHINKALMNWNRGNLCRWIKLLADPSGIRTLELPPHWTSRVCSHCGSLGVRFNCPKGQMQIAPLGKLFGCPRCGLQANADFNASVNLHKVFFDQFPRIKSLANRRVTCNGQRIELANLDHAWQNRWQQNHAHENSPF